jgi:hypothetical protein
MERTVPEKYHDEVVADAVKQIARLQADYNEAREEVTTYSLLLDEAQARIEALEGAIEFAFNNASNSFMGVNFSFEAVKKLRAATEQESKTRCHIYKRKSEELCANCGQWLGGPLQCCGDPASPARQENSK